MLFNSLHFLVFFPVVVALYFATPHRFRWILLLAASYYFYAAWRAEYLLLIMFSTLVDYVCGLRMGRLAVQAARRKWLYLSLASNLGLLFAFKYFNFFSDSTRAILNQFNIFYGAPTFDLLLPVGISFYTFQTLSYAIDVYRGRQQPERHLGVFALYVSFFPQLVAGPIERSTHLLPQFFQKHEFDASRVTSGLRLVLWGFFKKLVIADRLAVYVTAVYSDPSAYNGPTLLLATYFFAFQIYCDFSGYSDIAIGTARVMGYDLMRNFRRPYFARSIAEFWSRWHISLSTWFRDYLYIPLGGNRVAWWRWYLNLFVVFLVSGLWHGANWTFVVWGALHGLYLVASLVSRDQRDRVWQWVGAAFQRPGALLVPAGGGRGEAPRFAPLRFAPSWFAPLRLAPLRFAAERGSGGDAGHGSTGDPRASSASSASPASPASSASSGAGRIEGQGHGEPAHGSTAHAAPAEWRAGATRARAESVAEPAELPPGTARFRSALAVLTTFHLVLFAWVFFRAASVGEAVQVLRGILDWSGTGLAAIIEPGGMSRFALSCAVVVLLLVVQAIQDSWEGRREFGSLPLPVRWACYYAMIFGILVLGEFGATEFIYFQF